MNRNNSSPPPLPSLSPSVPHTRPDSLPHYNSVSTYNNSASPASIATTPSNSSVGNSTAGVGGASFGGGGAMMTSGGGGGGYSSASNAGMSTSFSAPNSLNNAGDCFVIGPP